MKDYHKTMPVHVSESQEHILDFLKQNAVAVLATVDNHKHPHAAAIYYVVDDDLCFFFITKRETAKNQNLQKNHQAALVIYEASSQTTVQANGSVNEETDATKAQDIFKKVLKLSLATSETGVPPISKLQAGAYIAYKFKPESVRMASFVRPDGGTAEKIFETA